LPQHPQWIDLTIKAWPDLRQGQWRQRRRDVEARSRTGTDDALRDEAIIGLGRASAPYIAAQGTRVGRSGRIHIHHDSRGVWVGGRTATLFSGICTV
jgi:predicted PhzF superfamily epimerase YddE/YHI9